MCASKKGISVHQVHRMIGDTYKTPWFMCHRISEAMRSKDNTPKMASGGGVVKADETFIGREFGTTMLSGGITHKMKVLARVDRNTGRSRAMVIDRVNTDTIKPILLENISRKPFFMSDEASHYKRLGGMFDGRGRVNHAAGEYVNRQRPELHTNTIEGNFSIFKRGMKGIYQHCGKQHLHRDLARFDFRYSNRTACGFSDAERADEALKGIYGRRITYRRACPQS